MGKQAFDRKLQDIEALRALDPEQAREPLRKALRERNNYLVGKAAGVVASLKLHALSPELAAAFERFLSDPVKTDPQCWAKNAIARALRDLDHDDPEVFQRGLRHVQMEPVFGGRADSAGTLRSICAHALVACRIERIELLALLTGLLTDSDLTVRVEAARAIAHVGMREGALPLRLKAKLGDKEPEMTGACFAALLRLSGVENLSFVAEFLKHEDPDVRMEAVAALAECAETRALDRIREFWEYQTDAEVKLAMLPLLAASPLPDASDLLLEVAVSASPRIAAGAIRALGKSRYQRAVMEKVRTLLTDRTESELKEAFRQAFGS